MSMLSKLKQLFGRLKQSKDGRTLVANFGYLSLLQVASYVFPLITMPYLARVIGAEGFGKIAFAAAIMVWFQTIADWGFCYTATRDVAKNRDDKEKVSEIFSNVLWARILLMFVSFVVLSVCVLIIPKLRENADVIMISFLMIPGHIMFPDWFFQAMERMKYITILNIVSKTLFTVAIFLFIKERQDYILQPLFTSLGFVISGIIAMYYILVKWKIRLRISSFKTVLRTIKSSTDVFINNIVRNFYNSFSVILLGFLFGSIANGILDAGRRFINIAESLLSVVSRVFFPFVARRGDKHCMYAKIHITISVMMSIVLFVFAPILIDLFFTEEFKDATKILRLMSIIIPFSALYNVYSINWMIVNGFEKQSRNITVFSSLIGFVIAYPLIKSFSYYGVGLILIIVYLLLGGLSFLFYKNNFIS
ncbi:MAG: flippase [Candidatus Onthomorpha sp.]|nr:flippase [Candidatus Onthomorpha sp.]